MPEWSQAILDANNPDINFKGFAVGNPFADRTSEYDAMWKTFHGHQLISKPTWDSFNEHCRSGVENLNVQLCTLIAGQMTMEVGNLNPYALDYPVCLSAQSKHMLEILYPSEWFETEFGMKLEEHPLLTLHKSHFGKEEIDERRSLEPVEETSEYNPCTENYLTEYLNQQDVKGFCFFRENFWLNVFVYFKNRGNSCEDRY